MPAPASVSASVVVSALAPLALARAVAAAPCKGNLPVMQAEVVAVAAGPCTAAVPWKSGAAA